jgi:transglutaminase-like putative cysteine protease
MNFRVTHTTEYTYREPVSVSHHLMHLTPRITFHQKCLSRNITMAPPPAIVSERRDYFGNTASFCIVQEPHKHLSIHATSEVEVWEPTWPVPAKTAPWETPVTEIEPSQFLVDSPFIRAEPKYADYARISFPPGRPMLEGLSDLTTRIHKDFAYDPRATTVATPLADVFEKRRGVCQDFAHLEIACLRSLKLPARYVSGYIQTTAAPGKEKLVGADASHAWLAAYCQGFGWIDVDPTNNKLAGTQHLTVAWGRDYSDVPPVRGIIVGGGSHQLQVGVEVTPLSAS